MIYKSLPYAMLTVLLSLANASADSFTSNGVKIHFTVQGKGEPVVLIHGFLSSGGINWDLPGVTKSLAEDFQVINVDLPGHGWSDKPTTDDAYGLELPEHIKRLLDHLNIKQAHVVGYSMGGIVAAKFTALYPERVRSTTLAGMGWLREGSFEQKFFAGEARRPPTNAQGVCFRSLAKLTLTEKEVKSIKTPLVVLFGEKDIVKIGYTLPLKLVRPDWQVIEIKGGDHLSTIMQPQFKEEIHQWLRKNIATKD